MTSHNENIYNSQVVNSLGNPEHKSWWLKSVTTNPKGVTNNLKKSAINCYLFSLQSLLLCTLVS